MKSLLVVLAASFAFLTFNDPLKNTRWDGTDGLEIYFTSSDTVKLLIDDKVVSSALYKVKDSILTWRDYIKSDATCDTSIRGVYVYHIKDSVLTLRTLSDRCEERANVLQTLVLTKK